MHPDKLFIDAFIYLIAAVVVVPLTKRLGFGSVLGYLIAGLIIGPFGFDLIHDEKQSVLHFAEFGVVMMLFLIGLELQPQWLWRLRKSVLGFGGAQVLLTAVAITATGLIAGLPWQTGLAIGLILSLSSTAIILQTLSEKGMMNTPAGRSVFSILLFQDMAVIPILAILPLLAVTSLNNPAAHQSALAGWQQGLLFIGAVAVIGIGGRYLIRPVFHYMAETRIREVFTATALLLVIGIALLMQMVGLSPALGTFLAGVVLADSEYRHELESDILPFKGLLLGLFFIAVGSGMDMGLLVDRAGLLAVIVLGLMLVKTLVLLLLAKLFQVEKGQKLTVALSLSQGGEFAFVLFGFAIQNQVISQSNAELLILAVALSMLMTPLILMVYEKLTIKREVTTKPDDEIKEKDNPVIIIGFGRFGQIVGRLLNANKIMTTVLDLDPSQIEVLRKLGMKVYYGDASRIELLRAAGAEKARLVIVAVDDAEKANDIIKSVKKHFPGVAILARAYNRLHYYELIKLGVKHITRETFHSSLNLGVDALKLLGFRAHQAHRAAKLFSRHDERSIAALFEVADNDKVFYKEARRWADDLERIIQSDHEDKLLDHDKAWELEQAGDNQV